MKTLKNIKKGQSLPMNTIVIAILVIIVLIIIVVVFTTQMADNNNAINDKNPTKCTMTNPVITGLGYTDVQKMEVGEDCPTNFQKISSISQWTDENDDKEYYCCGKPKQE